MNLFFYPFTMEDAYRTLEKPADGLFRDRNSRFLAFGFPVENLDQVNDILAMARKKYHDAKHHCYAYRLGYKKEIFKMNDDGEPSGTAGKPIYNQILAHDLTNILVIVVRYFGGTLLGTGGLIHAYKTAAGDMLQKASIIQKYIEDCYHLSFPYEKLNAVMKILKDEELVVLKPLYGQHCSLQVLIRQSSSSRVTQKFSLLKEINIQMVN